MTGGVLPRFHVVAFQKVCTGEGAVDCRGGLGLVVDPHSIGRGLLRDRKGRRWTQIAAQAAFFYHQFQTLHRQRAGTGQ